MARTRCQGTAIFLELPLRYDIGHDGKLAGYRKMGRGDTPMLQCSGRIGQTLRNYREERDALLGGIEGTLRSDPRIAAAWLFGSLGRRDEDDLSDLDLWVVVQDSHIADIVVGRRVETARVMEPLFVVEAPQNAPRDGAYLAACCDAPIAPHLVDWYWQPASQASIPRGTRLLFDRVGLPRSPDATPGGAVITEPISEVEAANRSIRFCWMMLMIAAKHAARSRNAPDMPLLRYALGALNDVRLFANVTVVQEAPTAIASAAGKLAVLRASAADLDRLLPLAAARGAEVPRGVAAAVERYFTLAEEAAVSNILV